MLNTELSKILIDVESVIVNSTLSNDELGRQIFAFNFEVNKLLANAKKESLIKHYAQGAVKAAKAMLLPDTEESKSRLEVCHACSEWNGKSCKVCGCYVTLKVRIPEEKCPHGKW
jgi:hypothetical protein